MLYEIGERDIALYFIADLGEQSQDVALPKRSANSPAAAMTHARCCRTTLAGAAQSPLTLASLIIGHHFAISAFCQSPSACGESLSLGGICNPRSSNFLRTAGSFMASTAAALSLATISFGVPFGTQSPDHSVM